MQAQKWIKSVNLGRNQTQLTYFASLSLKAGELKNFTKRRDSWITETAKYEQNVLRSPDYAKQLNNLPQPQGYAGKMNSHVVLIMRSSVFIRSRSPQSPYLKLPNELGCDNKHDTNGWVNLSVITVSTENFLQYSDEPLM